MKEFWNSVNIWQKIWTLPSRTFFETQLRSGYMESYYTINFAHRSPDIGDLVL